MRARFTSRVNPRIQTLRQALDLQASEMETMTDIVDSQFVRNERRLFATEGASGGESWQKLSPAYAKWKAKRFPGRKILARTGKMRKSLTGRKNPLHVAQWTLKPRKSITLGTNSPTAPFHVGPLRSPRMPERDPMQHTPQQEERYSRLVFDYLVEVKLPRVERALSAWRRFRRSRVA